MQVMSFLLGEAVTRRPDGLRDLMGVAVKDVIIAPGAPPPYQWSAVLFIAVLCGPEDAGSHETVLQWREPDETETVLQTHVLSVESVPGRQWIEWVPPLILPVRRPGLYVLRWRWDDMWIRSMGISFRTP
ncbi:hypothetical protein [Sulfobacillus harzensis]|uniref:Uncharacterized protein n=1 Tax=Sulfobacillus harzensis TaxID=2729629 RepID=A0A7Y0L6N7_9FIRM|nr:hypothetical protein [Sulfobacillus harzensis]NMP23430.1 hypothetical protein [Sulfobacillus harzensis]